MDRSRMISSPWGWLRNRRLIAVVSVAGIAGTLLIVVAASSAARSPTTASPDSLVISVASAPLSLDPAKAANNADQTIINDLAYEPLINLTPSGRLAPGLATSWKYADGSYKRFDLTLRPGVRFSNGQRLTAAAVATSLAWQKKANGPVAVYRNMVKSVQVLGPLKVRLHLVQANPVIGLLLTQRFVFGEIIAPHGSANPKALGTTTEGAGQYMLDPAATTTGSTYVYVPNPYYYNKSAVHFKKITVRVIPNNQTALNAVKSGQVAFSLGSYANAAAAEKSGVAVYAALEGFYGVFLLDRDGTLVPALKSSFVRQALNYAVDRVGITKALFGKYGKPNEQVSIPGYEDQGYVPGLKGHYAYNVAKAKQLLTQAGYPDGFTMSIGAVAACGNGIELAQAVASDWQKIGVTVDIKTYADIPGIVGPWGAKQLPATMCNYDAQPMFIEATQLLAKDSGFFNIFGNEDPTLTALIAKGYAATTKGPAAVRKAWADVTRRVVVLGWEVPIATGANIYFANKALKGVAVSPTSFVPNPVLWRY